jgi:hypothetical protein
MLTLERQGGPLRVGRSVLADAEDEAPRVVEPPDAEDEAPQAVEPPDVEATP